MRFEWDNAKAAANRIKHGVAFEDGVMIFSDPLHRSRQDRHQGGEERWQTLGMVGTILLLAAHTWREEGDGEVIRLVSVRRATKRERREFEQA